MTTKESEVDVLARLRRHKAWLCNFLRNVSFAQEAEAAAEADEVIAAVAGVFEASADLEKAVREETEHLKASAFRDISECDKHRVFENRVVEATDRLRTALRNAGVKV